MKGQKKKQNGITLIALVISIIVMLILAGVSINALMGDNGILRQAQYASFMSEMAAVEEAVQLWGADHYDDENHSIPAKGAVQQDEIDNSERLGGEIGYYRTWSRTNSIPATSVTTPSNSFNSIYLAELVYFPGGVEDLYYLDNEGLDLSNNKKYVIDAENSMIYSVRGISLNGVRCYSLAMAKAVMNGTYDAPEFASAEVSGSQASGGVRAAGNTEPQYIDDGSGNLIENPNYNPYGFRIISGSSDTIYKLYNNGELWGKGLKSIGLDYSPEELATFDTYSWVKYTIPDTVSNIKKVYIGEKTIFISDTNNHLFAYGDNSSDKLGLTEEERNDYTGSTLVKLKINGSDVINLKNIFSFGKTTYLLTTDNSLYVAGANQTGGRGVGYKDNDITTFTDVSFLNNGNKLEIKQIREPGHYEIETGNTYVLDELGNIYSVQNTDYKFHKFIDADTVTTLTNSKIKNFIYGTENEGTGLYCLLENGDMYYCGQALGTFKKISSISGISEIYQPNSVNRAPITMKDSSGKILIYGAVDWLIDQMFLEYDNFLDNNENLKEVVELNDVLPEEMLENNDEVVFFNSFYDGSGAPQEYMYIMKSGKVWMSGRKTHFGLGSVAYNSASSVDTTKIELVIDPNGYGISTLNNVKIVGYENNQFDYVSPSCHCFVPLVSDTGNLYITLSNSLMFGEDIMQKNWKRIASEIKVKDVICNNSKDRIAIIDFDGNAYFSEVDWNEVGVDSVEDNVTVGNTFRKLKNITNVASIGFAYGSTFVLTNDGDLYSAGKGKFINLFTGEAYTGFWYQNTSGNHTCEKKQMTLLRGNIRLLGTNWRQELFVGENSETEKEEIYFLGYGQYGGFNEGTRANNNFQINELLPLDTTSTTKYDCNIDITKVKKLLPGWENSIILLNDGNLIAGGNKANSNIFDNNSSGTQALKYTTYSDAGFSSPVVDVVMADNWGCLVFLTSNGDVYCTGYKQYMGLGNSSARVSKPTKVMTDVIQITTSNKNTVVVKKDGSVWGTGDNSSGILGRWVGSDRNKPNSRYRTAFEWVECPELEI